MWFSAHQLFPWGLLASIRPPVTRAEREHCIEVLRVRGESPRCAGRDEGLRRTIDLPNSLEVPVAYSNHETEWQSTARN